jgi:hypothetical protein
MKAFIIGLIAMIISFAAYAEEIYVTTPGRTIVTTPAVVTTPTVVTTPAGVPIAPATIEVPVERDGDQVIYYPNTVSSVATEEPYYYAAENKTCYSREHPELSPLSTIILNAGGINRMMYCYPTPVTSTPVDNYYGASE